MLQRDHPAVQLALSRARSGSLPLQRADGSKLGLVVEGGGMRGAVSAGSLMALHQLGLKCEDRRWQYGVYRVQQACLCN